MADRDPSPDRGCALRPDGTLKDASEIDWQFDVDDDITPSLSGPSSIGPSSGPSSGDSGPSKIHPFFSSAVVSSTLRPATFAAGSRRSGRATRPSNRILDPDNAMGVAAGKRPAQKSTATRNVKRKIIQDDQDSEEEDASFNAPPTEPSTDVDDDDATDAVAEYDSLKAMADADHEVSACYNTFKARANYNLKGNSCKIQIRRHR